MKPSVKHKRWHHYMGGGGVRQIVTKYGMGEEGSVKGQSCMTSCMYIVQSLIVIVFYNFAQFCIVVCKFYIK